MLCIVIFTTSSIKKILIVDTSVNQKEVRNCVAKHEWDIFSKYVNLWLSSKTRHHICTGEILAFPN